MNSKWVDIKITQASINVILEALLVYEREMCSPIGGRIVGQQRMTQAEIDTVRRILNRYTKIKT